MPLDADCKRIPVGDEERVVVGGAGYTVWMGLQALSRRSEDGSLQRSMRKLFEHDRSHTQAKRVPSYVADAYA